MLFFAKYEHKQHYFIIWLCEDKDFDKFYVNYLENCGYLV